MVLAQPRALFPALAYKVYGGGATTVGVLQAAPALGALVAFAFSGWITRVRLQGVAIAVAVVVYGAAVGAVALTTVLWAAVLLLALSGMADMISAAYRSTVLQVATPDQLRGRPQGVFIVVAGGPRAGDFIAGSLAEATTERVFLDGSFRPLYANGFTCSAARIQCAPTSSAIRCSRSVAEPPSHRAPASAP